MATVVGATPAVPIEAPATRRRAIPPSLIIGGTLVLFLIVISVFAPEIAPDNPLTQNIVARLQGPSAHHLLGTDQLGRDTLSRLIYGARTDLKVGFLAVLFPFIIGTFMGSLAGYFGQAGSTR